MNRFSFFDCDQKPFRFAMGVRAQTLQLLVLNSLRGLGKQIFHPHSHTTLSDIACIVASLGAIGEFCEQRRN